MIADFPSLLAVAAAGAMTLSVSFVIGRPFIRFIIPDLNLAYLASPALGLALYGIFTVPVFLLFPFKPEVAGITLLIMIAACQYLVRRPGHDNRKYFGTPQALVIAAAILALAPAATVFPQISGDSVGIGLPIFDHAKIAIIAEIHRTGVPPDNPFFSELGVSDKLNYYYLWYFIAAQLALLPGISGWEADIALTWATAFFSLLVMSALAIWLSRKQSAGWWVLAISLAGPLVVGPLYKLLTPIMASKHHPLEPWSIQASWVPQHLFSATIVLLVAVAIIQLGRSKRIEPPVSILVGIMCAAAYASSAWIGGVTLGCLIVVILATSLQVEPHRSSVAVVANLALAAVVAVALASPFLYQHFNMLSIRPVPFIQTWLYPVFNLPPGGVTYALDLAGYWLFFLVVYLPAAYPLGMFSMLTYAWDRRHQDITNWAIYFLFVAISCFLISQCLQSVIKNNDLGWRAMLPGALISTVFAAIFLSRSIPVFGTLPQYRRIAAGAGILLIAFGGISGLHFFYSNAVKFYINPQTPPLFTDQNRRFIDEPEVWSAVRRHTPLNDRVGNNPLAFDRIAGLPANIGWALFGDRRSCTSAREYLGSFAPHLVPERAEHIERMFIKIFGGSATLEDVKRIKSIHRCQTILLVPTDGLWNAPQNILTSSTLYRLVEERSDRWRIYRATNEPVTGPQ